MLIKIQTIQKLNVIIVSLPPAAPQVHDPTRGNHNEQIRKFLSKYFLCFYVYIYMLLYIIVKLLKSI